MFAAMRPAVAALLSRLGMQGLKAPIARGLAAIKPQGAVDTAFMLLPDVANQFASQAFLPKDDPSTPDVNEGASAGDRLAIAAENFGFDTLGASLGGRFAGGALAPWALRRFSRLQPRTQEYKDALNRFATGTEVALGFGFGYAPKPITNSVFERAMQRAQGDPQMMEQRQRELEEQQQAQMLGALVDAGAAGVGGLYRASDDPFGLGASIQDMFRAG